MTDPQLICQVGLGTTGSALLWALHRHWQIIGVDKDVNRVADARAKDMWACTREDVQWQAANFFIVSVPTPLSDDDSSCYNLDYLRDALTCLGRAISRSRNSSHPVVAIRSTVSVGTTTTHLIPLLETVTGRQVGSDIGIVYSPEFLRAEHARYDISNAPEVVYWASDCEAERQFVHVMSVLGAPFRRHSCASAAEAQKVVSSSLNATMISAFNEWRMFLSKACPELSSSEIQEIFFGVCKTSFAKRDRYGAYELGPYGGACLPKDVKAAQLLASQLRHRLPILDAVAVVNEAPMLRECQHEGRLSTDSKE
ncbi:MAG: hypothetical protein AAGA48_30000 [Myxococcota bacterium]